MNKHLSRLAMPSVPSLQGDDMQVMGQLFLTAEEVPALVMDEDNGLTDCNVEGSMDEGED